MKCTFVVGQKVVCIKDTPWRLTWTGEVVPDPRDPKYGQVLTIRELTMCFTDPMLNNQDIFLCFNETPHDWPYHYVYFKPVEDKKTDISQFEKLLTPKTKKKVLEDA